MLTAPCACTSLEVSVPVEAPMTGSQNNYLKECVDAACYSETSSSIAQAQNLRWVAWGVAGFIVL